METNLYAQLNTSISVRDSRFLTKEQLDHLLTSKNDEGVSLILQATDYRLTKEELRDPNAVEDVLLRRLASEYDFAFEQSPYAEIVQIFALRYTYHNLKVLFKERASQDNLENLLIPIGRYPISSLRQLVSSLTSEQCPEIMQEEVAATWAEYLDYQDIRVLDIGMDLAYFKHLKYLVDRINHPILQQFIELSIDFYNVITVKRGLTLGKPRSFMRQLLSEEGQLKAREYLKLFHEETLLTWFNQIYPNSFDLASAPYEQELQSAQISALDLEFLADLLKFQLLEQGRFEVEGPLPLARYLWGKELEVKNLRLILTGRSSELDSELLRERMRPVYGQ